MQRLTLFFISALLSACVSPAPYAWQDTRQPAREDAIADFEVCKAYAAKQYQPGTPAGEPYLNNQGNDTETSDNYKRKEWRPDRSPFPTTNVNAQSVHNIQVDYTGYPGELDYYPSYLDDILEKCMRDRGWAYREVIGD